MILIRHGQTEFNRVFSLTRQDPGIRDPDLTAAGRRQAAALAQALARLPGPKLRRLIASPYRRALETAEIVAAQHRLPIAVEALVAERCVFACDIGSPRAALAQRWPALALDHLPDPWWPQAQESEAALGERAERFREKLANESWHEVAVVTHWGFIRALTGLKVANGTILRIDPSRPECEPALLFAPPPE
ncbi:MAG TPA: histidine phosphatase family protein [Stellaceae bacterium]|nr:histidine phosphatase family protein [Stellaceae bacterium]